MKTEFALASAAFAAALLCLGAPALAGDNRPRVPVADLNLSTARGAEQLDARIAEASRDLCRSARRPGSRISDRTYCTAAFHSEVVRQLPAAAQRDYALARLPRIEL
jgi:UrcA family protein